MRLINEDKIFKRINEICIKHKLTFLGFCDKNGNLEEKYKTQSSTFLHLKCNVCGYEWKSTNYARFLKGKGCKQCVINNLKISENDALKLINEKCSEYNYTFLGFCDKNRSIINWNGIRTYLILKCNNCGNTWKSCTITNFIRNRGCPKCKKWILEEQIKHLLIKNEIEFEEQKTFQWLKFISNLRLDFYVPSKNIAIECQGEQHFELTKWSKDEEENTRLLKISKERDERKRRLCEEHGIKILYFSNLGINYPYEVYEDENELLKEILKNE